jgi:hypothetical protein
MTKITSQGVAGSTRRQQVLAAAAAVVSGQLPPGLPQSGCPPASVEKLAGQSAEKRQNGGGRLLHEPVACLRPQLCRRRALAQDSLRLHKNEPLWQQYVFNYIQLYYDEMPKCHAGFYNSNNNSQLLRLLLLTYDDLHVVQRESRDDEASHVTTPVNRT